MAVQDLFDFLTGNVFAARNDDIFGPVFYFGIAVWVHDGQIARTEPAAAEGLARGGLVLQVAFHERIAAHDQLTQRLPIGRHRLTVFQAGHGDLVDSEQRSEEHTSELQSLMRISYAVFCLKKKNTT